MFFPRLPILGLGLSLLAGVCVAQAPAWSPGTRVMVDKAGSGRRAIVLRVEPTRLFVAFEGADESFDEWVELAVVRPVPRAEVIARSPTPQTAGTEVEQTPAENGQPPIPEPEPLPPGVEIPRPRPGAVVAEAWLERLPREDPAQPVQFNTAHLAAPVFRFGALAGIPTTRPPAQAVLLKGSDGRVGGMAAIEDGVVIYRRDPRAGFVRAGALDLAALDTHAPEHLAAADLNGDGLSDLVVAGGNRLQVYFASASGEFQAAARPYVGREQVRGIAPGRFFLGALPWGVAIIEDFNTFRLLTCAPAGVTPAGEPYRVKFQRITRIVAGDFDGDGLSDLAIATDNYERSTGAWMYFNQRGVYQPFLWPVGGRDDFARGLHVADLDRDGRDDLILTDSDSERGERLRVVFGAAGRAGWEDPWELIGAEYGIGFGTDSVVTADFNGDGRIDIGVGGRNGLRIYLGADYRRFARNPVWPRLEAGSDFPEQRRFVAGDIGEDGVTDVVGYTPLFATGYNLLYGATPPVVAGTHVPGPLRKRVPTQASGTSSRVAGSGKDVAPGVPQIQFLASRAEPYGQYRYRVIVEVATFGDRVIAKLEAVCKYAGPDSPVQEVAADATRQGERQWFVEATVPRVAGYDFTLVAVDDQGRRSEPLQVSIRP